MAQRICFRLRSAAISGTSKKQFDADRSRRRIYDFASCAVPRSSQRKPEVSLSLKVTSCIGAHNETDHFHRLRAARDERLSRGLRQHSEILARCPDSTPRPGQAPDERTL